MDVVWGVEVQLYSFAYEYQFVPATFVRRLFFSSIELSWHTFKIKLTINMTVYYWTLSSVPLIDVCVFFCQYHTLLIVYLGSKFWNWKVAIIQLGLFFSRLLVIPGFLQFPYELESAHQFLQRIHLGFWQIRSHVKFLDHLLWGVLRY